MREYTIHRPSQYNRCALNFSLSGHRVVPNHAGIHCYAATKHAVKALTEGLRNELSEAKTHIRVTVSKYLITSIRVTDRESERR